ncbi:MAG TPA: 2TM domain-containing protein [Ktedonobacterales bacterium]
MQTTPTLPTTPSTQGPVTPDLEQQQRREQATKRIRDKNAFKLHLVAYLVINALFVVLWALSGIGYFWPIFPIVGWGAGVAVHGYCVYGGNKVTEAQIERDMKRLP